MPSFLLRDRVTLACLGLVAAVLVPYVLPVLGEEALAEYNRVYAELPLLVFLIAAFEAARRRASSRGQRTFWGLFVAGSTAFALAKTMFLALPDLGGFRADLAQDLLYVGFYASIAVALELRFAGRTEPGVRGVRIAATLTFIAGLLAYFILVPGLVEREAYDTYVPSIFLFVVLDAHLVVRLAGLSYRSHERRRDSYRAFLVGFLAWFALDLAELLSASGAIPWPERVTLLDALWFLPYVPMVIGTRLWKFEASSLAEERNAQPSSVLLRVPTLSTQPLFYAVVFPMLHFGAYIAGPAAASLRDERERLVLLLMPVLAGLSFLHHRLLEKANERLEVERERVAEAAQQAHRMEAIGRLASGIAHDFNNLIQVIRGANDVLASRIASVPHALANSIEIAHATMRASKLTDQLLAVGRTNPIDPRPVELNEVVRQAMSMVERVLGEDVDIDVVTSDNVGHVLVDRAQLEQVILNLAINARDAMPHGGSLRVETARVHRNATRADGSDDSTQGTWAVLVVADTGIGMSDATKARVFEPFFTTKSRGKGTGLGLSTAYGFVSRSGGFVELETEVGEGAQFRLYFPSHAMEPQRTHGEASHELTPHRRAEARPRSAFADRTILVVDNEKAVRAVIRELLEDAGFVVRVARGGHEALHLLEDGVVPDLMLTDVRMPGMPGPDLSREVRRRCPATKVVYMTGYAPSGTDANAGLEGPVLTKPFTRDSLQREIETALSGGSE